MTVDAISRVVFNGDRIKKLAAFCERYKDGFNRWWDDLGVLYLDPAIEETLVAGVTKEANGQSPADLSAIVMR